MTDGAIHFSGAAMRCWKFAARLGCLFHRAMMAQETRCALNELPDDLLRDIGLNRSEIPYVADALASGIMDQTGDARAWQTATGQSESAAQLNSCSAFAGAAASRRGFITKT